MKLLCSLKNTNLLTSKIEITDLVFGGDGIGKLDGKVCFVPLTAPGDVVEVRITEEKKDYSRGEVVQILQPSTARVVPPCEYYEKCGGCNWQHLNADVQAGTKEKLVKTLFQKSFGDQWLWRGIVRSPKVLHYRNKIGLKWSGEKLGYFQRRSHVHLPIRSCLIADESINQQINSYEDKLKSAKTPSDDKKTYFIYSSSESAQEGLQFSQVNDAVNVLMKECVLSLLPQEEPTFFYDFYAGHGNFTFPTHEKLKEQFKTIPTMAVEYDAEMVQAGRKQAGKRKIQFTHAKVEDYLRREKLVDGALVLLDPPRAGCDDLVIDALLYSSVKKIIYVSCNPTTLHRDLKRLLSKKTFHLVSMQCFDMFPQTDHVEVVAEIVLS